MKKYLLQEVGHGTAHKKFATRNAATAYMVKCLGSNEWVEGIIKVNGNKHFLEYRCSDYHRFFISRTA